MSGGGRQERFDGRDSTKEKQERRETGQEAEKSHETTTTFTFDLPRGWQSGQRGGKRKWRERH